MFSSSYKKIRGQVTRKLKRLTPDRSVDDENKIKVTLYNNIVIYLHYLVYIRNTYLCNIMQSFFALRTPSFGTGL